MRIGMGSVPVSCPAGYIFKVPSIPGTPEGTYGPGWDGMTTLAQQEISCTDSSGRSYGGVNNDAYRKTCDTKSYVIGAAIAGAGLLSGNPLLIVLGVAGGALAAIGGSIGCHGGL